MCKEICKNAESLCEFLHYLVILMFNFVQIIKSRVMQIYCFMHLCKISKYSNVRNLTTVQQSWKHKTRKYRVSFISTQTR